MNDGYPSNPPLPTGLRGLISRGTITTDLKVIDGSVTWNNAGVTFTGIKLNVTDTASNAASMLIDLQVGGSPKFRVTKSGKVGVNTDPTSDYRWQVLGSASIRSDTTFSSGDFSFLLHGDDNRERFCVRSSSNSVIAVQKAQGTIASPSASLSGDELGSYHFGGYDGSLWIRSAWILGYASENWSGTNRGSHLVFSTTPIGSTTIAERMRIAADGAVGIGVAPTSGNGLLQLASGTTKANGIAFGSNEFQYRVDANVVSRFEGVGSYTQVDLKNGSSDLVLFTVPGGSPYCGFGSNAANVEVQLRVAGNEILRLKTGGQVKFTPLSSDPGGAANGDVYYNSTSNKLRVYAGGSWVDLH